MPALTWTDRSTRTGHPRRAIAAVFFVHGLLFATWVARIPGIKHGLGLDDARLGVALLAVGLGTFLALPLTAWLIARCAGRPVALGAGLSVGAMLTLAALAPSLWTLLPALLGLGAGLGVLDVAMNAQAARLEQSRGRSLMSSFHALWSLGGLVGAGTGALFAAGTWPVAAHFGAVAIVCAGLMLAAWRALPALHAEGEHGGEAPRRRAPLVAWPTRPVLALGGMAVCGAIVEGGIADWSAVYLRDALGTTASFAACGYAAFAVAMMAGRLSGDRLIERYGARRVLRIGAWTAAGALGVALLAGQPWLALAAFAVAGLGVCTVFPVAFSLAGRLPDQAPGQAIAAVATMAYGAGLAAPALIGFVAALTGLPAALSVLVLCSLGVARAAARLQ